MDSENESNQNPISQNIITTDTKSNNQTQTSGKKLPIILLSALSVISISVAIIFAVLYFTNQNTDVKTNTANTGSQSATTIENNTENVTESTTENLNSCKPVDCISSNSIPALGFNYDNIVNKGNLEKDYLHASSGGVSGAVYLNSSLPSSEIQLTVEKDALFENKSSSAVENHNLSFPKKVVDFDIAYVGQNADSNVALFLLEDGSISYLSYRSISNDNYNVMHNLGNLSNITKFYQGEILWSPNNKSSYATTFAQNTSGEIYNLGEYLQSYIDSIQPKN